MSFFSAITTVVGTIAIPYGYTLAIWSAGALAIVKYGIPRMRHVLLFVAGSVWGYLMLDIPVWYSVGSSNSIRYDLPPIALINLFPLATAITSALLVIRIPHRGLGFTVVGFTATVVYILSLSVMFTTLAH